MASNDRGGELEEELPQKQAARGAATGNQASPQPSDEYRIPDSGHFEKPVWSCDRAIQRCN